MQIVNNTEGNPLGSQPVGKLITKFSIPAIISLLVNALYNIADQVFIGQGIGLLGMAATNVALPLNTISTAIALLLGVGGAANFNLLLGKKETEEAQRIAGNTIFFMAVSGVALGIVVLLFAEPLLYLFGATSEIMPYARPYTRIIALGIPAMIFSTGACNLIRADGSPAYAMRCMLIGATFNLVADPILLFVFHVGIEGIAWTTTLGQMISCGIAIYYFVNNYQSVHLTKTLLRPRAALAQKICALGAAACFNQLAMTTVQVVLNNVLRHYGSLSSYGSEIPLACVGVIAKIYMLFLSVTIGISQGCQPIYGFNYGAKQYGRVRETYMHAVSVATAISVLSFLIFQLFPRQILTLFDTTGGEQYFSFGMRYLRIFMLFAFINGIQPVTSGFFSAIGKAKIGLFMALTRQILFLLPLLILLPPIMGIDGVMFAGPVADAAAALYAIVFASREMRTMKRLDAEQMAASQIQQPHPLPGVVHQGK